jgi:hypothetical protein
MDVRIFSAALMLFGLMGILEPPGSRMLKNQFPIR